MFLPPSLYVIIHIINTICIGIALVQKFLIFTFLFFRDTTFTVCWSIGISFKPKKLLFTILQDPPFSWYFIRWTWPMGKLKNAEYFVCVFDLLFLAEDGGIVDGSQPLIDPKSFSSDSFDRLYKFYMKDKKSWFFMQIFYSNI